MGLKPEGFSHLLSCFLTCSESFDAPPTFSTNRDESVQACIYQACLLDIPHASRRGQAARSSSDHCTTEPRRPAAKFKNLFLNIPTVLL